MELTVILFIGLFSRCFCQTPGLVNPPELSIIGSPTVEDGEEHPYIDVPKGSRQSITCKGGSSLSWTYPTDWPITADVTELGNEANVYESELTITNMIADNTGLYKCHYGNGTHPMDLSSSIYIFVNDPAQPLRNIPGAYPYFPVYVPIIQNRPRRLPCFVTNSNATMQLVNAADRQVLDFDQETILYSKQGGIVISFPTVSLGGDKNCIAELSSTVNEQRLHLLYRPNSQLPIPDVESVPPQLQEFLETDNITLKCSVKMNLGVGILMDWIIPDYDISSDRFHKEPAWKRSVQKGDIRFNEIISHLDIYNARLSDTGVYSCKISTSTQSPRKRDYAISIHEKPWVQMSVISHDVYVNATTRIVDLCVDYRAHPQPKLTWYKDGTKLVIDDNKIQVAADSLKSCLSIRNPLKSDDGRYELFAESHYINKSIHINVNYLEKSRVTLETPDNHPFYRMDQEHTVTCTVQAGLPRPTLAWFWQSCESLSCTPDQSPWTPIGPDTPGFEIKGKDKTQLRFTPSQSGYIQCMGDNSIPKYPPSIVVTQIFITDLAYNQGFVLDESKTKVIEGDTVEMSCQANQLAYTNPKLFMRLNDGYRMMLQTTDFSSVVSRGAMLTLNESTVGDSGGYVCQVENRNGTTFTKSKKLTVLSIINPTFEQFPNISYHVREDNSVIMRCRASGRPKPEVTWWQDDVKVDANKPGFKISPDYTKLTIGRVKVNDSGNYSCRAENRGGVIMAFASIFVKAKPKEVIQKPLSAGTIGGIVAGVIVLVLVFIIIISVVYIKMKRNRKHPASALLLPSKDQINPDIPLDEQTDGLAYDEAWEFPRDRLKLGMILGQGAFGKVVKAQALGIEDGVACSTVAVKMVRDSYDMEQIKALISELKILIHIGQHLNIMNLLGAVTKELSKGELYVIVEYCPHGNLRSYLLKHKGHFVDTMGKPSDDPILMKKIEAEAADADADDGYLNDAGLSDPHNDRNPLTTRDLVCWCFQISRGMEYLASRKYIHRDLAARNILLAADNVVKICDFGLAKDVYKYNEYQKKTDGPLPIKWMALESLTHKVFTSKTDVWAYGIFMWELFSLAQSPYPGVELNETFIEKLKNGYRMARPEHASVDIYQLMLDCWRTEPELRPDFSQIAERTGDFIQESLVERYICLNDLYGKRDKSTSDGDGYLRMNSQGYLAMSPTDPAAAATNDGAATSAAMADPDEVSVHSNSSSDAENHYANKLKKHSNKEKGDEYEMQPMMSEERSDSIKKEPLDLKVDFTDGSAVTTTAIVHRPPGQALPSVSRLNGPSNNDDVFLPSSSGPTAIHPDLARHSSGSGTSSGFLSDYWNDDSVPPNYNAVTRKERLLETDC